MNEKGSVTLQQKQHEETIDHHGMGGTAHL